MFKNSYINTRGYVIYKKYLTEEQLDKLKKVLTIKPFISNDFTKKDFKIKNYLENKFKIYIPKHFGISKFGLPEINKLNEGEDINVEFEGNLRQDQLIYVNKILFLCNDPKERGGILCLKTGQGKTVIGIYLLCKLAKKALIVVHKSFLIEQWKERISQFAPTARIGLIKAQTIDIENKDFVIASLQSLALKEYDPEIFKDFSSVIFDESHHLSAEKFKQALHKTTFKYMIGLSATPNRKDGLTKVFTQHIGTIIKQQESQIIKNNVIRPIFKTDNKLYNREFYLYNGSLNLSKMINNVCENEERTKFVVEKMLDLLNKESKRKVLLLSDRKEHLKKIKELLDDNNIENGFYHGGLKQDILDESIKKQVILGTYSFCSEGFDVKDLDTLVLASPKSDIVQICGRITRKLEYDFTPTIIDIIDDFSLFSKLADKRLIFYNKNKFNLIV